MFTAGDKKLGCVHAIAVSTASAQQLQELISVFGKEHSVELLASWTATRIDAISRPVVLERQRRYRERSRRILYARS